MSAALQFQSEAAMPTHVKAIYVRHFNDGSQSTEVRNECQLGHQVFSRSEKQLYVSFGGFGLYSPEEFDLEVSDCDSNQVILTAQNLIPEPDVKGAFCRIAEFNFEVH